MTDFRTCNVCGVALQIGETCNCQQPVSKAIHKDGLTASCPLFSHRSTYRKRFFINCRILSGVKSKREFATAKARNTAYARHCCNKGIGCNPLLPENDDD